MQRSCDAARIIRARFTTPTLALTVAARRATDRHSADVAAVTTSGLHQSQSNLLTSFSQHTTLPQSTVYASVLHLPWRARFVVQLYAHVLRSTVSAA